MQIALAAYVIMVKQDGGTVYVCRPLTESTPEVRDPLLHTALQRLGAKSRPLLHQWVERGHAERIQRIQYDPECMTKKLRLHLVLRDRTVEWKLLFVLRQACERWVAFTPSIPDLWFDLENVSDLEHRAQEVMLRWCQDYLNEHPDQEIPDLSLKGDAWVEPVDMDLSSLARTRRQKANPFASLLGAQKMRGEEELRKVGRCLDELVADFSTAVGRDDAVRQLDQWLQRKDRQPILLVGPSGVGKTAILENVVMLRAHRQRQDQRKRRGMTWLLSPQRLISGMSYLGQWEERWLSILREAAKKDHVLYIDDLLGLLTAGVTRDSNLSLSDVFKSFLAQDRVRVIAEISAEGLAVLRRRDRALADRFHLLHVPALEESKTLSILHSIGSQLEADRGVFFHPSVLPSIVEKQRTLAPHLAFPGKAIEVLKNLARLGQPLISRHAMLQYLKQTTGVSIRMLEPSAQAMGPLREAIERRLIGQPEAIDAVERIAHRACYRLSPSDRPHGVLLFLGPTGVGKTECAKALSSALFADETHLLRFDMNEITTSAAAEQLIGSFEQPDGRLTSAVRKRPFSVVLFDEIEKAHPDVFDYLLQVLGEGRLTDAHGRTVDFRNTVIIMTSNLGVQEDQASLGFEDEPRVEASDRRLAYTKSAQRFFRPEFFNRIDEVVVFRRLARKEIAEIAELQLSKALHREGMVRREIYAYVHRSVLEWLVDRGFDRELGARAMKRAIENHLIEPLGELLAQTPSQTALWAELALLPQTNGVVAPKPLDDGSMRFTAISGPIGCRLVSLRNVEPIKQFLNPSVSAWIDFAETTLAKFTEQLATWQGPWSEETNQDRPNQIHYYAIHDQVFRCRDRLKQLKLQAELSEEPKINPMQVGPSAVKRSSNQRVAGDRRFLRQYQSEKDIEEAIQDSPSSSQPREALEVIRNLKRDLALAHSLMSNIQEPSRWKLEVMHVSGAPTYPLMMEMLVEETMADDHPFLPAVLGLWDPSLYPAEYFLAAIASTLHSVFQYEVTRHSSSVQQIIVSGIGVAGLLKSIEGTYRIQSSFTGRDLVVIVATPFNEPNIEEQLVPNEPLLSERELEFDWTNIRGWLSEGVKDLRTNAGVSFDASRQTWAEWWMDLLPPLMPDE